MTVAASSKYLTCPTESLIQLTRQAHPRDRDNDSDGFLFSFLPALCPSDSALCFHQSGIPLAPAISHADDSHFVPSSDKSNALLSQLTDDLFLPLLSFSETLDAWLKG